MIRKDYYGGQSASLNLTQSVTSLLCLKPLMGAMFLTKGKIHKVPTTDVVTLKSPLMGLFEFHLGDASYLRYKGLQVAWNVSTK